MVSITMLSLKRQFESPGWKETPLIVDRRRFSGWQKEPAERQGILSRALTIISFLILLWATTCPVEAQIVDIDALLELDLRDWHRVHSEKALDQCRWALMNKQGLNDGQLCKLHRLKAYAHQLNNEPKQAIIDLTEALRIRPNDCEALRIRGEVYSGLGEYDKARADFESILRARPKDGTAHAHLAICLCESGHKKEALELAEKAISFDPDVALGYLARADIYLRMNEYPKGIKDLNQCIALSPGEGTLLTKRVYLLRARMLLHFYDNTRKSLPDLLMARRLDLYDPMITGLFCEYYFKRGAYKTAFHICEKLPELAKTRSDLQARIIDCLLQRGQNDEALRVAETMVRDDPKWGISYVYRGLVFFSQRKYEVALAEYDRALLIRRDGFAGSAAKAYLLATCPEKQCRDGSAARKLATICCQRTQYSVPRHLMLLAMASAECGDYEEAVHWAKASLEKTDGSFPFLEDYKRRLSLFEKGTPFRLSPDKPVFDYLCP